MTRETKKTSGFILLTVPSIIYGGYFLLTILSGQQEYLALTHFQKSCLVGQKCVHIEIFHVNHFKKLKLNKWNNQYSFTSQ